MKTARAIVYAMFEANIQNITKMIMMMMLITKVVLIIPKVLPMITIPKIWRNMIGLK